MKELFQNSKGYNLVTLIVKCKIGTIDLHYRLHDNPVQHIWQEIHLNSNSIIQGNSDAKNYDSIIEDLKINCSKVGETLPINITQGYLNNLHSKFVNSEQDEVWNKINVLIHLLENKIDNPLHKYDSSFNFYSNNDTRISINPEYKMFLGTDSKWGRLSLGYATKGKDWLRIFADNDNDNDLAIQQDITSETYVSFSPEDPFEKFKESNFYKWAVSNIDIDVPIHDLSKLSFGRYVLGDVLITDAFLNYNSNVSDWYVPNHICKWNWNKNILGNDIIVKDMQFSNSSLAYEITMEHSCLK